METLNKLLAIDINFIIIGLIVVFYTMENIFTTQFRFNGMPNHLLQNILFQVAFYMANLLWAFVTVFTIEWLNKHEIGLFYLVTVPLWLKLALGVMMFDFVNYWFHRTAHRIPLLWRFHRVHHSDTRMDASTNLRAHPIKLAVYFGTSNIVAAAIFGLDLLSLGLFFLIITPYVFLEHSNIKFPVWLDKTLGLVFTTPNMHKVHHHWQQPYTDSNYGLIFSFWDRMFGTFIKLDPSKIRYGLDRYYPNEEDENFLLLMKKPFRKME